MASPRGRDTHPQTVKQMPVLPTLPQHVANSNLKVRCRCKNTKKPDERVVGLEELAEVRRLQRHLGDATYVRWSEWWWHSAAAVAAGVRTCNMSISCFRASRRYAHISATPALPLRSPEATPSVGVWASCN